MAEVPRLAQAPELKDFLQERTHRVYSFIWYALCRSEESEALLADVFRAFGEYYRREVKRKDFVWEPMELELALFSLAWKEIHKRSTSWVATYFGTRDGARLKIAETNLLENAEGWTLEALRDEVTRRLSSLDMDYRGPIVLCDLLGFNDEEALRVLGLRWGVFRHRLHRGRLDLSELLEGAREAGTRVANELSPVQ